MATKPLAIFWYLLFLFVNSPLLFFGQIKAMNGKRIPASEMDGYLEHQMDSLHIPSLSIAFFNKGKIIYHKTLGYADVEKKIRADEQTLYEAASISKTVFACFIMKMVDKGVIALDSPLYKYYPYPEIAHDSRYKLFTARMVLAHTTGLPNWHEYEPPDSSLHVPKGAQYIKFQPGTRFSYSGEGYQYLVNIIAHLLNTNLVDLGKIVDAEVCNPLGMGNSTFSWNEYVEAHRATGYRINRETGVRTTGVLKKLKNLVRPEGSEAMLSIFRIF